MIKRKKTGFTLIEVLIVVAILAILALLFFLSTSVQRNKADDVKIKSDLGRLKIAFEDYYNDHNCYPPKEWFDDPEDCGSHALSPYLETLSCDRHTNLPYLLETDQTGCGWFKLTAKLANFEPIPGCLSLSCLTSQSYHVSSSNINPYPLFSPDPTSTSTPKPTGETPRTLFYYCQGLNNCTAYDPARFNCTPNFQDTSCGDTCSNTIGSCTNR